MLRVLSDVLTAADARHVTLIELLDLTAVFDCVDHTLLLRRLRLHRLRPTLDGVARFRSNAEVCPRHCDSLALNTDNLNVN